MEAFRLYSCMLQLQCTSTESSRGQLRLIMCAWADPSISHVCNYYVEPAFNCPVLVLRFLPFAGLKVMYKAFPERMISGSVPASCVQSPPGSARKKPSTSGSTRSPMTAAVAQHPVDHRDRFTLEGEGR